MTHLHHEFGVMNEMDQELQHFLISRTEGEALEVVRGAEREPGLEQWRRLAFFMTHWQLEGVRITASKRCLHRKLKKKPLAHNPSLRKTRTKHREHIRDHACVHAVVCGMKLADPGISTEPRGLTASQSRSADIFTTASVPGRSAALDVSVASSVAAAARGDATQVAFDRKLSIYRDEIVELRQQGIHCRPLIWTADGRPHPAVIRALQYAADIASSRNGQQMPAKSLQRRWKH